ncbi:MAG: DUF2723 domain-containing protein [Caldilineaceae bacterium]
MHFVITQRRRLITLFIWLIFFTLYAVTAAPSIVELFDDSLEFQLVGPTFGIAHPTGYPLYVMVGGLWSRLLFPVGNWAWRMNLLSALAAATTITLLFRLTNRLVALAQPQKIPWAGLAAAVAFGLAPVWWAQATVAEVYALHNLLIVAVLSVAVELVAVDLDGAGNEGDSDGEDNDGQPQGAVQRMERAWSGGLLSRLMPLRETGKRAVAEWLVTLLCLLLGLGLSHHRTIVLLGPGLVILFWGMAWLWRPSRRWWRWGMALIAPLGLYLWIPLRAAMGVRDLHGSYENSLAGFLRHILALDYAGLFAPNLLTVHRTPADWGRLWQQQLGLLGLALGAVGLLGLFWLGRSRQSGHWLDFRISLGLLVVVVVNTLFAVSYQVGDQEVFMLPAWLGFAIFIGIGVGIVSWVLARWPLVAQVSQALCLLLLVLGGGGRGAPVDRSHNWVAHDYAVAMAKVPFPPHSQVIALEGQATALRYMQEFAQLGRNATPIMANDPDARRMAITTAMAQGYPTYITQEVAGIADQYSFSGEGPLVRVWPRGAAQAGSPQHESALWMADETLELVGYNLDWLAEAGGPTLSVTLYWRPVVPLQQEYKVSLRLLDPTGALLYWPNGLAIVEDHYPLRLVAPTTTWLPGEVVRDVHALPVTPSARAEAAQLQIILYDAATVAEAGAALLPTPP